MFKENNKFSIDKSDLVAAIIATGVAVGLAIALNQPEGGLSNLGHSNGKSESQTISGPGLSPVFRK